MFDLLIVVVQAVVATGLIQVPWPASRSIRQSKGQGHTPTRHLSLGPLSGAPDRLLSSSGRPSISCLAAFLRLLS